MELHMLQEVQPPTRQSTIAESSVTQTSVGLDLHDLGFFVLEMIVD